MKFKYKFTSMRVIEILGIVFILLIGTLQWIVLIAVHVQG